MVFCLSKEGKILICGADWVFASEKREYSDSVAISQLFLPQTVEGSVGKWRAPNHKEEERRRGSIWDRIIMDFAKRGVKPFVALFLIEIALFLVISALPFLPGEQSLYTSQGNQIGNEFQGVGLFGQFVGIFANNFRIALIEMVPIIGPILFAISIYETARVSEALALTQGLPPVLVVIVLLLLFPHSWLELPAYAVATMEGLYLFYALLTSVGGAGAR